VSIRFPAQAAWMCAFDLGRGPERVQASYSNNGSVAPA
jgi:hypothetical protein